VGVRLGVDEGRGVRVGSGVPVGGGGALAVGEAVGSDDVAVAVGDFVGVRLAVGKGLAVRPTVGVGLGGGSSGSGVPNGTVGLELLPTITVHQWGRIIDPGRYAEPMSRYEPPMRMRQCDGDCFQPSHRASVSHTVMQ
jgi:hypothetical protein